MRLFFDRVTFAPTMTAQLIFLCFILLPFNAQAKRRSESVVDQIVKTVSDATVNGPKDGEICFSPDEPCDVKLWKFIQSAQKSVDLAVFDITHPKIVHEILVLSKKLSVRVIVDRRQSKGPHSLVSLLLKGGANVRFGKQRGIMHNKFTIVDGKRIETGSYNYTNNASKNNQENQIYLADPETVNRYRERFEKMWREGKDASDSIARN